MAAFSKGYCYIPLILGAAALFAAGVVRRAPGEIEDRLLEEIEVVVYIDQTASGEDLNNFKEEINDIALFSLKELETSARVLRKLKEDEMLTEQLEVLEGEFSPPHRGILRVESFEGEELPVRISQVEAMPNVQYVEIPGNMVEGISVFLKRVESVGRLLFFAFAAAAVLLICTASFLYFRLYSQRMKVGLDTGASFLKVVWPGLKRQFLTGVLGGIIVSSAFYLSSQVYEINIFTYETAAGVSGLTGILSLFTFIFICLNCAKV